MFGLFKKKNNPQPIFENLVADMHSHMLPGVDDGSGNIDTTIACMKVMKSVGFKRMYLTPHFIKTRYPNEEKDVVNRFQQLKKDVEGYNIGVDLAGIAGEYRIDSFFEQRVKDSSFLKIADEYVLVELSLNQQMMGSDRLIEELQMNDHVVVLAHPERYLYMDYQCKDIERLRNSGVLIQVNILSLDGFYGQESEKRAYRLIENGWVDFLGTDLHNMRYAEALIKASNNKKIEKLIIKNQFLNSDI